MLNNLIKYKDSQLKWDGDSFQIQRIKDLESNPITFLDTNVKSTQTENGLYQLIFSVHCKAMGTYSYVHKRSYHPSDCKKSIAYGEATRRLRLSTLEIDYEETLNDLRAKLMRRGYTWNEIERQFAKAPYSKRPLFLNQPLEKFKKARDPKMNSNVLLKERLETKNNVIPMVLRYDPRIIKETKIVKKAIECKLNETIFGNSELGNIRMILAWKGNTNLLKQLNKRRTSDQEDIPRKRPKLTNPELD